MSVFQGNEWINLMTGYETDYEKADTQLRYFFQKLGRILENKSALFWHVKSFDHYLRESINPFGLHIQIFPNVEHISQECKKEREENLKTCSREIMLILTKE